MPAIEQGIASTFEKRVGARGQAVVVLLEPLFEKRLLTATCGMAEAARDDVLVIHDASIGDEGHVRQARRSVDQHHICSLAQSNMQSLPFQVHLFDLDIVDMALHQGLIT